MGGLTAEFYLTHAYEHGVFQHTPPALGSNSSLCLHATQFIVCTATISQCRWSKVRPCVIKSSLPDVSEVKRCNMPSHIQLSPLYLKYSLSTLDITHMIKFTRLPPPILREGPKVTQMCACGEEPGNEAITG